MRLTVVAQTYPLPLGLSTVSTILRNVSLALDNTTLPRLSCMSQSAYTSQIVMGFHCSASHSHRTNSSSLNFLHTSSLLLRCSVMRVQR
ncbi:hypothetical protein BaRGS_00003837 [Batillaria attramentaria]|uniref:Uncharacterized protein n=1 Tax=Batillaria attramentaria TaxID=370345 RepID=A0ABD0LZC1_9CAEN